VLAGDGIVKSFNFGCHLTSGRDGTAVCRPSGLLAKGDYTQNPGQCIIAILQQLLGCVEFLA
jgi:hypothetical protein